MPPHYLPQKGTKMNSAIAAGPRPKPQDYASDKKPEAKSTYLAPDLLQDPWAQAAQLRGLSDTPTPARSSQASSHESRSVSGPIAEWLQIQDSKLQEMEATIKDLKMDQDKQFTKLSTQNKHMEEQLQQQAQQMHSSFDFLRNEQQSLSKTVSDAMEKQEHKLTQTFEDLKLLLANQRGTKRGEPEKGDEEDMTEGIL